MQQTQSRYLPAVIFWTVLLVVLQLASCGPGDSLEEQVQQFVRAGEEAVEGRETRKVAALISENYLDVQRRTRRDIVALAARYLYVNKNIHLLTRIDQLEFPSEDRARFNLYVAMTGQNVSGLDSLLNMQADLYRFDVELVREKGDWLLASATWRPARSTDFF